MKKITTSILLLLLALSVFAGYYKNVPVELTQPDKTVLHCFATGDEFYHWVHDADGFTIVQSSTDGYFYYAQKVDGKLIPSPYRVGLILPQSVGLLPELRDEAIQTQAVAAQVAKTSAMKVKSSQALLNTGLLANVVIYIRFKGEAEFTKTRKDFITMLDGTTTASLKGFYNEVSYGKLNIQSTHFPVCDSTVSLSYEDTLPRNYFSPYNAVTNTIGYVDDNGNREQSLVERAINAVKSQVPANLVIDANGDGNIDNLTVVVHGNADGWGKLLWPHQWVLYMKSAYMNGKKVDRYIFITENMYNVNTMCHEMFHVVGGPDLYHYTGNGITPVGAWDIMDGGSCHMSSYMKWKYTNQSWITTMPEITKTGDYSVKPLSSATNNCFKIKSPYSSTEFFVVEYRKKAGLYEANVPQTGLVIYRINSLATGNGSGPPDEVYACRPQGSVFSNGTVSSASFSNLVGRASFNNTSNPRAFLSDGSDAGVNISNIVLKGDSMTFHVTITDPVVQKSQWTVRVDSYESSSAYSPGALVTDDNSNTIWHTPWSANVTTFPHWIEMNFAKQLNIKGFKYLPRQDMENGRIKDYEFLTSNDAVNWTSVVSGTFPTGKQLQIVTFPERNCKYAKLIGKNEVNGKTFASMAELDFVFNTTMIPKSKWTLLNASSYETGKEAKLAFDSLGTTFWTSKTSATAAVLPQELAVNMNNVYCLEGASYLPRQDGSTDGTIAKYEFYTSMDAANWKLQSKGQWANNTGEKVIAFPKTVCRYFKLVALSEVNAKTSANAAEISVFGVKSNDSISPVLPLNFRISSRAAANVKLAWDKDAVDKSILYYKVFTPDSIVGQVYTNELTLKIDTTKNYNFSLQAYDGSGNVSETAQLTFTGITDVKLPNGLLQPTVSASANKITVSNLVDENTIVVYNSAGQMLVSRLCNSSRCEIDMPNYVGNVAVVVVSKNNKAILRRKILLESN